MEKEKQVVKFKFKLRWRDKFFLLALGFLLLWIGWNSWKEKIPPTTEKQTTTTQIQLRVGKAALEAEVAVSPEKRYRGLSGRSSLEENTGMLFLHEEAGRQPYVMREMHFPLDFIFIKDGAIVELKENVPPDFKETLVGEVDYDSVLEVAAGWIREKGLALGDRVTRIND